MFYFYSSTLKSKTLCNYANSALRCVESSERMFVKQKPFVINHTAEQGNALCVITRIGAEKWNNIVLRALTLIISHSASLDSSRLFYLLMGGNSSSFHLCFVIVFKNSATGTNHNHANFVFFFQRRVVLNDEAKSKDELHLCQIKSKQERNLITANDNR